MEHRLMTPIGEQEIRRLRVGDLVLVDGLVVTLRDAGHKRAIEYLRSGRRLPIDLEGLVLYHMGPVVRMGERGWEIVAAGPTTSARLEAYEPELIKRLALGLLSARVEWALRPLRPAGDLEPHMQSTREVLEH
jgi:fumarate hydratase subunit beta